MRIERYSDLPVGIRVEAVCGSGCEVHPGVAVEGEAIALHLHVGPVGGDDPHLAVALHLITLYSKQSPDPLPHLDAAPVDGGGGGHAEAGEKEHQPSRHLGVQQGTGQHQAGLIFNNGQKLFEQNKDKMD